MFSTKTDQHTQKSVLQIKQDDKFFCRLLTKESSISNPSFRVAITVPFVWESQPGTPKHTFSNNSLPPLTPPPSYYNTNKKPVKNNLRSKSNNLLLALFPKLNLKKTTISSSKSPSSPSNSTSSSSSSSLDSTSSKMFPGRKIGRRRFLSYGSSFDFRGNNVNDYDDEEEGANGSSPTSTLCFGFHRSTSTLAKW